jgi:hypothetical protein
MREAKRRPWRPGPTVGSVDDRLVSLRQNQSKQPSELLPANQPAQASERYDRRRPAHQDAKRVSLASDSAVAELAVAIHLKFASCAWRSISRILQSQQRHCFRATGRKFF